MSKKHTREGITAAGTWIVDYTKVVSRFPEEGACTSVLSETLGNGGAPYNLLVNLCRLGFTAPLRAVGWIGQDIDGGSIVKDCRAHGIDSSRLHVSREIPTSFSDVMTHRDTGIRTSFNHAGANALLKPDDFDLQNDNSRILYLGTLFFLAELDKSDSKHGTRAAAVLAAARKQGMLTCIDIERTDMATDAFLEGAKAALKQTDLLILNVEVAERLSGIRLRFPAGVDFFAINHAAQALQAISGGQCVVIRFPAGALAITADGLKHVEGSVNLPKSRVVNAVGAGHAFAAGFLHGYHDSLDLSACLKNGHAAAAACLAATTSSNGIRTMSSCLDLFKKYGQRQVG
jgi:sugar/nucleoside kinase (ribokinase family)